MFRVSLESGISMRAQFSNYDAAQRQCDLTFEKERIKLSHGNSWALYAAVCNADVTFR